MLESCYHHREALTWSCGSRKVIPLGLNPGTISTRPTVTQNFKRKMLKLKSMTKCPICESKVQQNICLNPDCSTNRITCCYCGSGPEDCSCERLDSYLNPAVED